MDRFNKVGALQGVNLQMSQALLMRSKNET